MGQSQWPRGLRRRSAAARLLRSWVRIPPGPWMSVCCECYVLSGRGLCDELITRPEESYWLWCVVVYDLETSWMRKPWPTGGCRNKNKQTKHLMDPTYQIRCFLDAFEKLQKTTYRRHVCLSDRMEQLGSHSTDFHEILYLNIFRKSGEKI